MSATATMPTRPSLMKELGAEYWMQSPLEQTEARIGRRSAKDRIYNAILRCSYAFTISTSYAVRPRLKREGFEGWVRALHKRIAESRRIRKGELNDEIIETDARGEPIPLSQADLAKICKMSPSHVSEAIKELREEGLVDSDDRILYALAFPTTPLDASGKVPLQGKEGSEYAAKVRGAVGLTATLLGKNDEQLEIGISFLRNFLQGFNAGRNEYRRGKAKELIEAAPANYILIGKIRDSDLHACMQDAEDANDEELLEDTSLDAASNPEPPPQEDTPAETESEPEPEPSEEPESEPAIAATSGQALRELQHVFPHQPLRSEALEKVHAYLERELNTLYKPRDYVAFVRARMKTGRIQPGLALNVDYLPRDYVAWIRAMNTAGAPSPPEEIPDAALPTNVRRLRAQATELEARALIDPAKYQDELRQVQKLLQQEEEAAGLHPKARGVGG